MKILGILKLERIRKRKLLILVCIFIILGQFYIVIYFDYLCFKVINMNLKFIILDEDGIVLFFVVWSMMKVLGIIY